MREAYRLNKHCLKGGAGMYFLIGYVYTGPNKLCDFKAVQEKIVASFYYLNKLLIPRKYDS